MKINPLIYLGAAERQAEYKAFSSKTFCCSRYSCLNIENAYYYTYTKVDDSKYYISLYAEYFKPDTEDEDNAWWKDDENEPRILALLLMYEIAKDLNKLEKKKVKKASSRKNERNKVK